MIELSDKIINAFQDECTDLLTSLEENILTLEKKPDNDELINELFRIVHSLKSETALMGFTNFSTIAHKFEDLFQKIRDEELKVDENFIELSFKVIDNFKELLNLIITSSHDNKNVTEIISELNTYFKTPRKAKQESHISHIELTLDEIKKYKTSEYKNTFVIAIKLFENVALKYARAYLIYNNLSSVGEIVKSTVDFQKGENDEDFAFFTIIFLTNKIQKQIYDLTDVSEVEKISIQQAKEEGVKKAEPAKRVEDIKTNSIRVNVNKIEDLMTYVGELLVNYNSMEKFHETLVNKKYLFKKNDKSFFFDIISQFKRIIDVLQDNVMKFRMVPIKTLFDKFPRLIRTISRELNKKVKLSISGEYTEVDKTVIDEIREPLTHIIRNSIDHGLESNEERIKKGKPEIGTLKISAYQSGNNIIVEITDDGRGIDIDKIKDTVIKRSLVPIKKLQNLKKNQYLGFIFLPGFSTNKKINTLSGRGVGMDVVKNNIEKARGKILIKTKKDKGTSIIISIPLTVAITKALIIRTNNIYFAIPLYSISETLRIHNSQIKIVDEYEVINLRKKLLSIVKLKNILSLDDISKEDEEDDILFLSSKKRKANRLFVIVVNYGNRKIGIIVDKLITEQDIVIKPLSEYINKIDGVSGATILGDGNVAYILDPINLIDYYLSKRQY